MITTTASDGSAASFTAVGTSASGIVSDTPFYFTMKKGSAYQFRFTGTKGLSYRFACAGSGTVVKPVALKKIGNSYFYKITAAEKGCVGIYSGGHRVCVVTDKSLPPGKSGGLFGWVIGWKTISGCKEWTGIL